MKTARIGAIVTLAAGLALGDGALAHHKADHNKGPSGDGVGNTVIKTLEDGPYDAAGVDIDLQS